MKVSDRLTDLAEPLLQEALEITYADLVGKHGEPYRVVGDVRRVAGVARTSAGNLGGYSGQG